MAETIQLGELSIAVTRKDIKNVHLSVHPPSGRVTLSAPKATRLEVARAYAISKLGWIREQQKKLADQARESPRRFINRESHSLWGRRHLMAVVNRDAKPFVALDHKRIILTVRPGSDAAKRHEDQQGGGQKSGQHDQGHGSQHGGQQGSGQHDRDQQNRDPNRRGQHGGDKQR
jgi:predicted metal-dependent hydrolase